MKQFSRNPLSVLLIINALLTSFFIYKYFEISKTFQTIRNVPQTASPRYIPDKITSVEGALGFSGDGPMIQLKANKDTDKPIIEWINADNNKIAWIVAHYKLLEDGKIKNHQHISIETVKEDYRSVVSRLTVTYGEDIADIAFPNAYVLFNKNLYMKDEKGNYWLLTVSSTGEVKAISQKLK